MLTFEKFGGAGMIRFSVLTAVLICSSISVNAQALNLHEIRGYWPQRMIRCAGTTDFHSVRDKVRLHIKGDVLTSTTLARDNQHSSKTIGKIITNYAGDWIDFRLTNVQRIPYVIWDGTTYYEEFFDKLADLPSLRFYILKAPTHYYRDLLVLPVVVAQDWADYYHCPSTAMEYLHVLDSTLPRD